jgi:hypothetical protein
VQATPRVSAIVTLPNVPPRLLQVLGGLSLASVFGRVAPVVPAVLPDVPIIRSNVRCKQSRTADRSQGHRLSGHRAGQLGWIVDADHCHTKARNFFDHNNIGNSDVFLPLTIDGALIQGNELTIRSPKLWSVGQAHVTYSNQTADGYGAINGGLTDFSQTAGFFALDHDQRNTANVGFDENLPWHAELNLSAGKKFGNNLSVSLTALNVTNRHLLVDNSLTFDGFHWDDPRQFYAQVDYKFGY